MFVSVGTGVSVAVAVGVFVSVGSGVFVSVGSGVGVGVQSSFVIVQVLSSPIAIVPEQSMESLSS